MVLHDLICTGCDEILEDELVDVGLVDLRQLRHSPHAQHHLDIHYSSRLSSAAAVHPAEAAVVWVSESEGKVQYPPRNDTQIPSRLQRRGYQRQELRSLKDVERFEKKHKVINEKAWYDSGSGHGFEGR